MQPSHQNDGTDRTLRRFSPGEYQEPKRLLGLSIFAIGLTILGLVMSREMRFALLIAGAGVGLFLVAMVKLIAVAHKRETKKGKPR